jgi:hypothetical protein
MGKIKVFFSLNYNSQKLIIPLAQEYNIDFWCKEILVSSIAEIEFVINLKITCEDKTIIVK